MPTTLKPNSRSPRSPVPALIAQNFGDVLPTKHVGDASQENIRQATQRPSVRHAFNWEGVTDTCTGLLHIGADVSDVAGQDTWFIFDETKPGEVLYQQRFMNYLDGEELACL